jgi:hypothetical protein
MNWVIRVGQVGQAKKANSAATATTIAAAGRLESNFTGFEPGMNADVTTSQRCSVTSNSGHVLVQLHFLPQGSPNADKTPSMAKLVVWQQVLSTLVGT